jgi:hypothetical protein
MKIVKIPMSSEALILYFCHCFQLPCFKAIFSDITIVDVAATGEAGTSYPSEAPCLFSVVRFPQTIKGTLFVLSQLLHIRLCV